MRHRLVEDRAGDGRVLLEERHQLVGDGRAHEARDLRVAELALRLALELRLLDLDADDAGEALAHVLAGQFLVGFLQNIVLSRVIVHDARQRALEALLVRAAVHRVDVVRKREDELVEAVGVLHGDFAGGVVVRRGRRKVDRLGVDLFLAAVQVLDEARDAALVVEFLAPHVFRVALVRQHDAYARIQERLLAQTRFERLKFVDRRLLEDFGVGLEPHRGAGLRRVLERPHVLQVVDGVAALEALAVQAAVLPYLDFQPRGQRVDDRSADAVQAAGNLIAAAAELAARVQNRIDDRDGRQAGLLLHADWDAAAVVPHINDVARQDLDVDAVAVAGKRLVDRVVDDLIDEVVQAARPRGADVHARALPDGLQTLENLDLV